MPVVTRASFATVVFLVFPVSLLASPAIAQTAQRTFVASTGLDSQPCSLTLPCRTFGAALGQTNDGGEIIVLDSAGYGPVTIDKSVAITAPAGIYAGITVSSGNGVTINAANARVVLRGLSINGLGGANGVGFFQGSSLVVERCQISNMTDNGIAIFAPGSHVAVADTALTKHVNSGLYIDAVLGPVTATVERVRFEANGWGLYARQGAVVTARESTFAKNTNVGLLAAVDLGSGRTLVSVADSQFADNDTGVKAFTTTGSALVTITRSQILKSYYAVRAEGGSNPAEISLEGSTIASSNVMFSAISNAVVVLAGGNVARQGGGVSVSPPGVVLSFGNNAIGNGGPVSLVTPVAPN